MRRSTKVNIVLEHIIAREVCRVDCIQLGLILDKLIVVICRRRICAIDLIRRHSGHISALISDMSIAAVCRIRVKHNSAEGCAIFFHIRRIEEADVLAVHLDRIRRDLAHIDDIGDTCGGRTKWRYVVRHISSSVYRTRILCGDMEMTDVDLGILSKDHAVRIDDVDVLAALDLTVDIRGVRTRNDVQIVVRLRAAVMHNAFPMHNGIVTPLDDVVHIRGIDVRIITAARDRCSAADNGLSRRRGKRDLWNQKSTRHTCEQCITHTLRQIHPMFFHVCTPIVPLFLILYIGYHTLFDNSINTG